MGAKVMASFGFRAKALRPNASIILGNLPLFIHGIASQGVPACPKILKISYCKFNSNYLSYLTHEY